MNLREYQHTAADLVFKEWEEHRSTLVVMPTGTGKTVLFSEIIRRSLPKRSIVLVHREELLWQAREKISMVAGVECDIEKAELAATTNLFGRHPVVIASVQTLISGGEKKRMHRFNPNDFSIGIMDEAHHCPAKSWKQIIAHFQQNPDFRIMGCTATPDRASEESLGQIFETVAFDYEILDAIKDGWLVPVDQKMVVIEGLDFSHVRTTCGDLNERDLADIMEQENNMQGVAGASIRIIGAKRSIVFTTSVKQAETVCNIFNRHRSNMAAWICGATPKEQRREILETFKSGKIQVVCNCNVLSEGFDDPGVECIIMARPTKSRALYAQSCGRSMRPLPGIVDDLIDSEARTNAIAFSLKPSCLIVDFVGNSGKHKLMSTADILGGNYDEEVVEKAVARAKKSEGTLRMVDVLAEEEEKRIKEIERRRMIAESAKRHIVAKTNYSVRTVNPFDVLQIEPTRSRGWDSGKQLSPKQRALLAKHMGINPDEISYAQGKQLLVEQFRRWNENLCSLRQANVLRRHYKDLDTKNLTRKVASEMMDALAKNGWRSVPQPKPEAQTLPF